MKRNEIRQSARELVKGSLPCLDGAELLEGMFGDAYRATYLGTVFSIMPSGKFYMPWACSNVDPCDKCEGKGCKHCGELGSREAFEDQMMNEALEAEAGKYGCWIESGEGDPCDMFLCKGA